MYFCQVQFVSLNEQFMRWFLALAGAHADDLNYLWKYLHVVIRPEVTWESLASDAGDYLQI